MVQIRHLLLGKHGVWLIDLAPLADPRLVPSALASVLGLEIRSDNPLPGLVALLRDRQMLLVLDNCEHVIEAAAALAAGVLRGAAGVHILATSREPLRAEGERVYRLSPLANPPASARLTAAKALGFPAVQLFVEPAAANLGDFQLSDADAPIVAEICRKLDGLPLAIEFAAARVDAFGVRGLAAHLDERLRLLTSGRRTAVPRHRTLSAALDWSYQLLTGPEQRVFRLAIFAGGFTLHPAGAVAADATRPESEMIDQAAELVAKSLVAADVGDAEPRLQLLDTTRAFALTKLTESGEVDALGRRHAEYYRELLETTAQDKAARDDWSADFVPDIDNIRAALTWAFAPGCDGSIGVALVAAAAPIWLEMSLLTECHGWARKALDLLDAADRGTRREMVLQNALGLSCLHIEGKSTGAGAALTRACDLAQSHRDPDHHLRALSGLALLSLRFGDFRGALAFAPQSGAVANTLADAVALSMSDAILSLALLHAGEDAEALTHAQRAYRGITPDVRHAHIGRSGMDYPIAARCIAARALWMQGLLDQSAEAIRNLLADAQAGGNPVSVCLVLAWWGCPISLRLGDLETAERRIALLKEHSEKHALNNFYTWRLLQNAGAARTFPSFCGGEPGSGSTPAA
jgi:predicted ATPase